MLLFCTISDGTDRFMFIPKFFFLCLRPVRIFPGDPFNVTGLPLEMITSTTRVV